MGSRRTEITIETRSVTIIRTSNQGDLVDCGCCGGNVLTFSAANASLVFGIDPAELHRAASSGRVHAAIGSSLCGQSLADYLKQEGRYVSKPGNFI
jgi:hypothetical protein